MRNSFVQQLNKVCKNSDLKPLQLLIIQFMGATGDGTF